LRILSRKNLKPARVMLIASLSLLPWVAAAEPPASESAADNPVAGEAVAKGDDVLIVRYASLIGGRETGAVPGSAGVLSREALSDLLLEWEPGLDNEEVRQIFALNELGELARQASQLPLTGGSVSGLYAHGDSSFEINMNIGPARSGRDHSEFITIRAEISRDGELISGPSITTALGKRAIVTATNGPEAPFFFLVIEVDRISAYDLMRRGLRHAWRKDYRLVDGQDVVSPVAIEKPQPLYPAAARQAKHEGRVVLRAVINTAGTVEDVEVVEGQPYGLNEAAVAAVRSSTFQPALFEGEPVAVFYLMTINFRLGP